ncbi:hypothetical protein LTR36_008742 [Oleoguttula mirabilis]|uniref:Uncharacterized protein n=1 Tax=Oleoguttula mirabilis TaxID=1507867 RepID=A0AAV9JWJ5_9PEZI|nr:hypothetical protein LTR36_008742 [Oleoguttula mirabilis]
MPDALFDGRSLAVFGFRAIAYAAGSAAAADEKQSWTRMLVPQPPVTRMASHAASSSGPPEVLKSSGGRLDVRIRSRGLVENPEGVMVGFAEGASGRREGWFHAFTWVT